MVSIKCYFGCVCVYARKKSKLFGGLVQFQFPEKMLGDGWTIECEFKCNEMYKVFKYF